MTGNNVSHAHNKTKRRFLPNLCQVTLHSEALGRGLRLKVTAGTLRTVDKLGGLDRYLLKSKDDQLSPKALKVKKELIKMSAQGEQSSIPSDAVT